MAIRTVSVALLQLAAYDRHDFSQMWPRVLEAVGAAASKGINVIVLPEVTIPGYVLGYDTLDRNEIARSLAELQSIADAHACVVVVGAAQPATERTPERRNVRNVAAVLTPHGLPQYSAKRFLWHFDEKWFDRGEDVTPIDTPFGKFGIVVCADGRIPTIASTLVDRGAELLVVVTAWVTSGRDPHALENIQADLLARVRAWENAVPLIAANKVGCELASVLYCGKSQIIDADGKVAVLASQDKPETLTGTVTIGTAPRPRTSEPLSLPPACKNARPARIAVTHDLTEQQYEAAAWSDVAAVLCTHSSAAPDVVPAIVALGDYDRPSVVSFAGGEAVVVMGDTVVDPSYLVQARRAGHDFFLWYPQSVDPAWIGTIARARAVELKIYIVVFENDLRITVVDPQGAVVAGSTATLHMPQFVYDPTLTNATTIVPHTDMLDGLAAIDDIRSR